MNKRSLLCTLCLSKSFKERLNIDNSKPYQKKQKKLEKKWGNRLNTKCLTLNQLEHDTKIGVVKSKICRSHTWQQSNPKICL